MGNGTLIEWTQDTWNPVTGCTKISQGCANCYAARMAKRLQAMGNRRYQNGFDITRHYDLINQPLLRKQPRMIFVNSMSDLFHEQIPFEFISRVFATMNLAHWHTFQILTKRSERLLEVAPNLNWSDNIWMGVTVENQSCVRRIADLRQVPAAIRFLSCEPLLESIDLDLRDIHWVIVGGESGPHARPMEVAWVRSIRDQCRTAGVPFFLKQWGGIYNKRGHNEAILDGGLFKEWPVKICCQKTEFSSGDQRVPLLVS